jgi:glycosyltransferase involved in cell wall biosynthesis
MACIREDETGWLVPVGDAAALREALLRAQRNRGELRSMGMAGLEVARSFTHREMHRRRRKLLSERLGV